MITACHFRVATPLWPFYRVPLMSRWSQLSAVCRYGQSGEVISWLVRCCLPLGLPSAASGPCAAVQKSPLKWQCGEQQASLKTAHGISFFLPMQWTHVSQKIHASLEVDVYHQVQEAIHANVCRGTQEPTVKLHQVRRLSFPSEWRGEGEVMKKLGESQNFYEK